MGERESLLLPEGKEEIDRGIKRERNCGRGERGRGIRI